MRVILATCSFLLLINLIASPSHRELEVLGINGGLNDDSIVVALFVNSCSLIILVCALAYLKFKVVKYVTWWICLGVLNIGFVLYWAYYCNLIE